MSKEQFRPTGTSSKETKGRQPMMWYSDLGIISIAELSGGPDDGGLGDLKVELWRLLKRDCTTTFCDSVDHFAIMLYVEGDLKSFGPDGFRKITRSRKDRDVCIEVVISKKSWQNRTARQMRALLCDVVMKSILVLAERIKRDGDSIDDEALKRAVVTVLNEFSKGV